MAEKPNIWVIMSFGSEASWEGNLGYSDHVFERYQFNNFVPNSRRVRLRDILIVRDRDNVLGFARILRLDQALGTTSFRRCPACGTTKINRRTTKQPTFRCRSGDEFNQPLEDVTSCTWTTIHYGDSFIPAVPPASVTMLEAAYIDQGTQLSIRPIRPDLARSIAHSIAAQSISLFDPI